MTVAHTPVGLLELTSFQRIGQEIMDILFTFGAHRTGTTSFQTLFWRIIPMRSRAACWHLRLAAAADPRRGFLRGCFLAVGRPLDLDPICVNGRVSLLMGGPARLVRNQLLIQTGKKKKTPPMIRVLHSFGCAARALFFLRWRTYGTVSVPALAGRDAGGAGHPANDQWLEPLALRTRWGAGSAYQCGSARSDRP